MQQRTRFTIQEIIDDLRMTSTTESHALKPKALTLLELCQTISDLRHPSSRSTAQILTRRLYLHPLTITTNAKQQSSKIINNNLLHIEQLNQATLERRNAPKKQKPYRGLAILSSSLPLTTRSNAKPNSSLISDSSNDFDGSTTTFTSTRSSLPPISQGTSTSVKRTILARPSYIPSQPKSLTNTSKTWEKIDVWLHLARTLQKPTPKDPPTTPLDTSIDAEIESVVEKDDEEPNYDFIHEIKIFRRHAGRSSPISMQDSNAEN